MKWLTVMVDGVEIANRVMNCNTPETRKTGLLDTTALAPNEGALLDMPAIRQSLPAFFTSIHMIGMRFPIAVAFLDRHGVVINAALAKQGRMYFPRRPARYVLEVHPDHLAVLKPGATVKWLAVKPSVGSA